MLVRRGGRIVDNLLRLGSCSSAGPARDQAKRRWLGRRGAGFAEEALDLAKRRWIGLRGALSIPGAAVPGRDQRCSSPFPAVNQLSAGNGEEFHSEKGSLHLLHDDTNPSAPLRQNQRLFGKSSAEVGRSVRRSGLAWAPPRRRRLARISGGLAWPEPCRRGAAWPAGRSRK